MAPEIIIDFPILGTGFVELGFHELAIVIVVAYNVVPHQVFDIWLFGMVFHSF